MRGRHKTKIVSGHKGSGHLKAGRHKRGRKRSHKR